MPQTISKNPWKYNPRLQPSENYLRTSNTNVILKNNVIKEEGIVEAEEIEFSKIKRKNSYDWKILETKEEIEDLKLTAETLSKIRGECIKIVTEDRPKPNIVFVRPKSMHERGHSFTPNFEIRSRAKTAHFSSYKKNNLDYVDSVLNKFHPTKFNLRKVKSSELSKKKPLKNTDKTEITLVINLGRGQYRPYTAGNYKSIAESQARTKRQLHVINQERFNLEGISNSKSNVLKESKVIDQELNIRVKAFCEKIEKFKRESLVASEYTEKPNEIFTENSLEILLHRLNAI
uniref:Uncharacterized protein n=1 Tax=Schmidtea mediterranea TaxID=79327 RepID=A0A5P8I4L5_SCHMD|nr:hypothetical protein [Schmidtea mediterranea]